MRTRRIGGNATEDIKAREMLNRASSLAYASQKHDGCAKLVVASAIETVGYNSVVVYGRNHTFGHNCATQGCMRKLKYGEDSCNHRLPSDCMSIHSEVDAISICAKNGYTTKGATIWVTRYPCEACARAIIDAGITKVVFGRGQKPSDMTLYMFEDYGIDVVWYPDYEEPDVVEEHGESDIHLCGMCSHHSFEICDLYYVNKKAAEVGCSSFEE